MDKAERYMSLSILSIILFLALAIVSGLYPGQPIFIYVSAVCAVLGFLLFIASLRTMGERDLFEVLGSLAGKTKGIAKKPGQASKPFDEAQVPEVKTKPQAKVEPEVKAEPEQKTEPQAKAEPQVTSQELPLPPPPMEETSSLPAENLVVENCPRCGFELHERAAFCGRCGFQVRPPSQANE